MLKVIFNNKIIIWAILISLALISRLMPHPWNFTPIGAIALFSGFYFGKRYAFALPILAMLSSDIFLGFYSWKLMILVYGSLLLYVALGFWLKKHKKWYTVLGSSLLCSVLFFLITNFAVWAFTPWYPKIFSGLIQCYIMAIPFFRNTLLGDLFYVTTFFGAYEIAKVLVRKRFATLKKIPVLIK